METSNLKSDTALAIILRKRYTGKDNAYTHSLYPYEFAVAVGHASMMFLKEYIRGMGTPSPVEMEWMELDAKKSILQVETLEELEELALRATERGKKVFRVAGIVMGEETLIAIAIGPHKNADILALTGHLPFYTHK